MWMGTAWLLVGNGIANSIAQVADIVISNSVYTTLVSVTMPRVGSVLFTTSQFAQRTAGTGLWFGFYLMKNGTPISRQGLIGLSAADVASFECSGATLLDVSAGDVISVAATLSSQGATVLSKASLDSLKYAYLT